MKKLFKSFLILSAIAMAIPCFAQTPNTLTKKEKKAGWELLFNGKDFSGWRQCNGTAMPANWVIEDNAMKVFTGEGKKPGQGANGDILYQNKKFKNFELSVDWKASKMGNSGIFYYVREVPGKPIYYAAPEVQVLDNVDATDNKLANHLAGSLYDMLPADPKTVNPAGEWNTIVIRVKDGKVTHTQNGKKVVEYTLWSKEWDDLVANSKFKNFPGFTEGISKEGYIGLQDHGYPIWFRNIKIKELPRKTREARLFNGEDITNWDKYGTELWYVKDGLLVCESGPDKQYGYLATREYYDDFDLTVEFKQEADGNSGVFIRSFVEEKDVKVNGWQVEVAPKGFDTGGIYESYGRGWLIQIPDEKENILKQGEWNTMRIRVQGDNVQTWLNGEEMVNIRDEKIGAGQGRIALQIHDGGGIKVLWRNLHLQTL